MDKILDGKGIPYMVETGKGKDSAVYTLEDVGGQILEDRENISFLYSNTELSVPKRFGFIEELTAAYAEGAEPFLEAKEKYLGKGYDGSNCTTVLDREYAKEEGICIWDSEKDSLKDFDRINHCIGEAFSDNLMALTMNEVRRMEKGPKGFGDEECFNSVNEPFVHNEFREFFSRVGVAHLDRDVSKKVYVENVDGRPVLFAKQLYTDKEGQQYFSRTCVVAPSTENAMGDREKARHAEIRHRGKMMTLLRDGGFLDGKKTLYEALASVPKEHYDTGVEKFAKLYVISLETRKGKGRLKPKSDRKRDGLSNEM